MRKVVLILVLIVLAVGLGAVYKTTHLPAEPDAYFGDVSLKLEYALTPLERQKGLSGREKIPEDYGMLFVFPEEGMYGFWMKDTLSPLDIFWLDAKGQVVSIAESVATSSYPNVFYPSAPALYVLETKNGFAKQHGITVGQLLRLKTFPSVSE
jgi:uncharacterized protein